MPEFEETANVILLDLDSNSSLILAKTHAWNFQQGSMLYWLPEDNNRKIIFNDTDGKKTFSTIYDIETGEQTRMPRAINAVGKTRNIALCVSFQRLRRNRKVCSYACEPGDKRSHPKDDGIFLMDLTTGEQELVVSLDDVWNANPKTADKELEPDDKDTELWFNHLAFNFDDSKLFFLARYRTKLGPYRTSMWITDTDGGNLKCLVDYGKRLSHFEWIANNEILITMKVKWRIGRRYVMINTDTQKTRLLVPRQLKRNGHPTISPQRDLIATDTYAIAGKNRLYIIDMRRKPRKVHEMASFQSYKPPTSSLRCDPHPRWNRSGTKVCYDGHGKNGRQVYVVDIKRKQKKIEKN